MTRKKPYGVVEMSNLWGVLENHGASRMGRIRTRKREQPGDFQISRNL